jgi:hypothetical protein
LLWFSYMTATIDRLDYAYTTNTHWVMNNYRRIAFGKCRKAMIFALLAGGKNSYVMKAAEFRLQNAAFRQIVRREMVPMNSFERSVPEVDRSRLIKKGN